MRSVSATTVETRAEFFILRDELDRKTKELATLRISQEFHIRRPVLRRVIRALNIIHEDLMYERDMRQTVEGVKAELTECLDENAVTVASPDVGTRLTEAKAVDIQNARREPTEDEALKGTIASTDLPAYIVHGAQGMEEVLVSAKVRVYV
jgi:hypothetical protein